EPQRLPEEAFEEPERSFASSFPALFGVLGGLIFGLASMFMTDDLGTNRPWLAIGFWFLSIICAGVGLSWSVDETKIFSFKEKFSIQKLWMPTLIFTAAWGIRAWDLAGHPWIISGTEAAFGIEKMLVIEGFRTNPFATEGLTNPLMPMFLSSFTERFGGSSVIALRWLSPIIGALTVLATFVIGRRFWGNLAGIGAALLLFGNHTHIHYSRLGLTNVWDPLIMLLVIGLVLVAWQKQERIVWLLTGLAFGLSFYFFTASHLLPILIPIVLISLAINRIFQPQEQRVDIRSMAAGGVLAFIVAMPQLAYYLRVRGRYLDRLNTQGVMQTNWIEFQGALNGSSPTGVWLQQWFRSIAAFLPVGQNDLSTYYGASIGFLTFIPSVLFIIGFAVVVFNFRRPHNQTAFWALLIGILGGGVMLTFPPQSHRMLILLPIVSIMGGIALEQINTWIARLTQSLPQKWLVIGLSVLALFATIPDIVFYFGPWQQSHSFTDRNTETAFEIAEYLNTVSAGSTVYLQAEPVMNAAFPTIGYLAPQFRRGQNIVDLPIMNGTVPELSSQGDTIFIILPEREDELDLLAENFPSGRPTQVSGFFADPLFTIYEITP
ncbi:MAG: glycosyltransferase family 39 protein, partial [Chloroflexota bacterium]